jgi:hypothetical protein
VVFKGSVIPDDLGSEETKFLGYSILGWCFSCPQTLVSTASTVREIRWWIGGVAGSVRVGRTVREVLADGPRGCCSSRVLRVLARFLFRSDFVLGFRFCQFTDGPSFSSGRSARSSRTVRFSRVGSDGSVVFNGRSVAPGRTVRVSFADCPQHLAGLSTRPLRTVRPTWPDSPPEADSLVLWFDSFLLLSCFRVAIKDLRLIHNLVVLVVGVWFDPSLVCDRELSRV